MNKTDVKALLDEMVDRYNGLHFIEDDPIQIPHMFSNPRDIEIAGFFAATLAWGQRKTIISKCKELMNYMDMSPYDFCLNHSENDLKVLIKFKHRTFNSTDLIYFITFFKDILSEHDSLEYLFSHGLTKQATSVEIGLNYFSKRFTEHPLFISRTGKHVASPAKKSACKRLNMYLRWMVRKDKKKVDFGIWQKISPAQLICPLDVHVDRVARALGLLHRKQTDWMAALELTKQLRSFDPNDPVKYDFALFGLGVYEKSLGKIHLPH